MTDLKVNHHAQETQALPNKRKVKVIKLFRAYHASIGAFLFSVIFVVSPYLLMYVNPPPLEQDVKVVQGVILNAQQDHPHIVLRLQDGEIRDMDFAGDIKGLYINQWYRYYAPNKFDIKRLNGCKATIKFDEWHGTLISVVPRIWSLECERERFSITYKELVKKYLDERQINWSRAILFSVTFSLFLLVLYFDFYVRRNK